MPDLKQTPDTEDPDTEDIDEPAAHRSIRRLTMVMGAALLCALLAGAATSFVLRRLSHQPQARHEAAPGWAVVLLVALVVLMFAAMLFVVRHIYRRPAYRRAMQYGWRRRRLVMKDLVKGRPISAEDMPVAAAQVNLLRSQGRWLQALLCVLPVNSLIQGLTQHGPMRWFHFALSAFLLVVLPYSWHERRKIFRNYERQARSAVEVPPGAGTL